MKDLGMQRTVYAEMLKRTDRELYNKCQELMDPRIKDWNMIEEAIETICETYPPTIENYTFIIAVVFYLFAEYKLHFENVRMESGSRIAIQKVLGFANRETVNYYSSTIYSLYKNPRWAEKVNNTGEAVLLQLNN